MSFFSSDKEMNSLQSKIPFMMGVIALVLGIILFRLYYLQIYLGNSYKEISDNISIRTVETKALRGKIYDRNLNIIADNRPYYEIVIIPQYVKDYQLLIKSLSYLLKLSPTEIEDQIKKYRHLPPFKPVSIIEDADFELVSIIQEHLNPFYNNEDDISLQGVEIIKTDIRDYLYPEEFSHVLGYLKEINTQDLERLNQAFPNQYNVKDLIGASGIEKTYDYELKGSNGLKAYTVDATGVEIVPDKNLEILKDKVSIESLPGNSLITTLDLDLQKYTYQLMKDKRGAVIALDPHSGEVLTIVSSPGYNANRIIRNIDKKYWQKINLDPEKYLFNRSVQAIYPPGSIYKIVSSYLGLELGILNKDTSHYCGGSIQYGNRRFKCWNKSGHGHLNLVQALAQSCDVYFYELAKRISVDQLNHVAEKFGFNQTAGIELPYEKSGLIPTKDWKLKRYGEKWIDSENLSLIIGQGYNLITPLQAVKMAGEVANGGMKINPHLVKKIINSKRDIIYEHKSALKKQVLNEGYIKIIQEGLEEVVHGVRGTAKRLANSPHLIAGKTGTAQVIGHDSGLDKDEYTEDHAWFIGYAPYDNPKIAVVAFVENGGGGSKAAAPIVHQVIDHFFLEGDKK